MQHSAFVLLVILTLSILGFSPIITTGESLAVSLYGTVTKQGCRVIEGIIVTETIDAQNAKSIELCKHGIKYFEIVYRGMCFAIEGTWTDPETGKEYEFAYTCDAPRLFAESWRIYLLSYESQTFKIPYRITDGQSMYMEIDPDFPNLILRIQSSPDNGTLDLTLPRELTDQQLSNEDDLIVDVDGLEVKPEKIRASPCFRTLSIPFYAGSEEIGVIYFNPFYGENFQGAKPIGTPYVAYPVYVTTDKTHYEAGELINVSGCTSLTLDDHQVYIEVRNPHEEVVWSDYTPTYIDGSFSVSVAAQGEHAIDGTYAVKATYAGQCYE